LSNHVFEDLQKPKAPNRERGGKQIKWKTSG
jgi:hypothetical protein